MKLSIGVALCLAVVGSEVCAQSGTERLDQAVWMQISAFRPSIDSALRVDNYSGTKSGTNLDLESELGLKKNELLPTLLLGARLGGRWRAEFEYFLLSRNARKTELGSDVVIDDTTFPSTVTVDSSIKSKVVRLSGGYSFHKTPYAEIGAVLGLHMTDFELVFAGQGKVGNQPLAARRVAKNDLVPLPTVGLYGASFVADRWLASGRLDLLALKARGYKGSLVNLEANVQYRISPNIGAGVGYRLVDYRARGDTKDFSGKVEYRFNGPQAFVDIGF